MVPVYLPFPFSLFIPDLSPQGFVSMCGCSSFPSSDLVEQERYCASQYHGNRRGLDGLAKTGG